MRPGRSRLRQQQCRLAIGLVLPALVLICALVVYPLGYAIYKSFTNPSGDWSFSNFELALESGGFQVALWNTVRFTALMVLLEIALGLPIALALQEIGRRKRNVLRALFLIPLLIAPVVAAYEWEWLLNNQYGLFSQILDKLGLTAPLWLANPHWAFVTIILVDIWSATPFAILIFQAALASFPVEVYDAARVDGASRMQAFWFITRPLLKPAFGVVLVIRTMDAFRIYDIIQVLTGGGPGTATQSLSTLTEKTGVYFGQLNLASAMAVLTLLPILAVTLVYLKWIRV
jgi:ABC-type sugar transport system permease subunit